VPLWKESVKELIAKAPPDWECLQLSYILFDYQHTTKYDRWEIHKNFCGTAAYLVTNRAAKRLMTYLCRFCDSSTSPQKYCIGAEYPYYHQADRIIYNFFNTYSICPPLFTLRDNNDSFIHEDHLEHHELSKEKTKKYFLLHPE
jgi:hypothetical protein